MQVGEVMKLERFHLMFVTGAVILASAAAMLIGKFNNTADVNLRSEGTADSHSQAAKVDWSNLQAEKIFEIAARYAIFDQEEELKTMRLPGEVAVAMEELKETKERCEKYRNQYQEMADQAKAADKAGFERFERKLREWEKSVGEARRKYKSAFGSSESKETHAAYLELLYKTGITMN